MGVSNDPEAQLADLYAAAHPRLVGFLTVLTGSHADAEDVAQEAFVQAWRHWSRIRDYDDPTAWLYAVATRLAISRGRRGQVARRGMAKLRTRHESNVADEPVVDRLDLDRALAGLGPEHRAVLLLHHYQDLSVAEVARVLHIAEGTVKSRLARGRAALLPLLEDFRSTP